MKTYIIERVRDLTDNYHSGGGLVVIAENESEARGLVATLPNADVTNEEWASAFTFECGDVPADKRVWVFPDAGCC